MRRVLAIAALVVVDIASNARAEDVTFSSVLEAARQAPLVRAAGLDTAAANARVEAAGAWAPSTVRVGTNRLTAQIVAGLTVPLPVLGTVGAARDEASAHARVVAAEGELGRREVRKRAMVAWLELARSGAQITTLVTAAEHAADIEKIARGRLDAGTGGEVDVTLAHAAKARADIAVVAARQDESARSAELAGVLGWDPSRSLRAAGALPGGRGELAGLRDRLANHPASVAARARLVERDAASSRARMQWRPNLAVELQASFGDPTLPGTDLFAGLSIEVPVFGHVGAQVRAAERDAAAERARASAVDAELAGTLVAAYRRWQAASERATALERDVVPAQTKASALAAQAFREGARDLATALQAARDLAAVETEVASARIDAAAAWVDVELAAGDQDVR